MSDPDDVHHPKLRVLHVLRAPLGGLFRHVLDLTREQVTRGHAVGLVVDSLTGGEAAANNLATLAPMLELGIKRLPMPRQPHVRDVANILRVAAHARSSRIDVVHGHGSKGGLYARLPGIVGRAGAPVRCYTPHGGSFNHIATPLVQSLYMSVEKLLARRTDMLLFESVFIANRFHQKVGDTNALVRIVQNGIGPTDFAPIAPKPDAAAFLYVGELRSAKGVDTLIDALAILTRRRDDAPSLILVGSGPDRERLEDQARAVGVADQVSFPGAMPARQAFALGHTLVVPSRAESLPYIVLEAAGARIPMVATDVGGIGEIFGPYRDQLIGCDDPLRLANALEAALEADPSLTRRRSDDLAAFVSKRFTVAAMADAVLAGYRDAFARGAAPAHTGRYFPQSS